MKHMKIYGLIVPTILLSLGLSSCTPQSLEAKSTNKLSGRWDVTYFSKDGGDNLIGGEKFKSLQLEFSQFDEEEGELIQVSIDSLGNESRENLLYKISTPESFGVDIKMDIKLPFNSPDSKDYTLYYLPKGKDAERIQDEIWLFRTEGGVIVEDLEANRAED
ncbi:MAG: hypothetical protein MRZ79_20300 [Bacteroidia bacterium]|nr:hypothetical protein [Bacteroidia bacterium]